ncbi:MAG: NADH-quinone oxidoreductase subunit NuoB [Hallerella sp.]|uniref:NADH-quinone oxidoreductase subunit B n=2 Tax=Fibrobacteraceae TaxID=204431 RepID=A0ABX5LMY3_9BACT|nr:NADH-quinone oxidoreductase subunit NuoB [Hallerella porci]MCI5601634.1 NADH-quinone oxidoreductase subunit NuoB [Hallerella sp.]PWL03772.1 NADH-quinone oxidoreductase B subunit [Hallerella porci]
MGIMNYVPKVLDPIPGGKTVVNAIDYIVNWAHANSLWPLTYGTSCCAIEMMSASMARYDIARFGSEVFRASPRQADLFILAGTITEKMAPAIQMLWEQIPGPKYVIGMGACTISGGPFYYNNYSVVRGAANIIPVDVYIPGCPPRPEALFHGLLKLREKIREETLRNPWHEGELDTREFGNRYAEAKKAWEALEKIKDEEMKEAREKFKAENPDYKSTYRPVRVQKEAFPEVPYAPRKLQGLSQTELFHIAQEKCADISVYDQKDSSDEALNALEADTPLDIQVSKENYLSLAEFLKNDPRTKLDYLIDVTAVDWKEHFDVIAQLMSMELGHKVFLRVSLPKDETVPEDKRATSILATVPSITGLYPGANWKEREVYDLFGIAFEGHPDMRRIFLTEDFPGYPLRKDFTHPHMILREV